MLSEHHTSHSSLLLADRIQTWLCIWYINPQIKAKYASSWVDLLGRTMMISEQGGSVGVDAALLYYESANHVQRQRNLWHRVKV